MRQQALLLDLAPDAISVRDLQGRVYFWNEGATKLYGFKKDDIIGKEFQSLLLKEESKYQDYIKEVLRKGSLETELRIQTKDGKERIVSSSWVLVRDAEGKAESVLVVERDLTEIKLLESQIMRTQRMESIGRLDSGIVHDLNNILTPILVAVGNLKEKLTDEKSKRFLELLDNSTKHGAELVKRILSFGKGVVGERITVNVKDIINETAKFISQTFPKNIKLRVELKEDNNCVLGDPTQLRQILLNICINSKDAMPNGGLLRISCENVFIDENYVRIHIDARIGTYVLITISDTGTGMTPEVIDHIFEPFYTTKGEEMGSGIGLSTVYNIVKSYGGFINVYSEPGNGSRFDVYIPAIETETIRDFGIERMGTSKETKGKGQTILVADDEQVIAEVAKLTLESNGFKVIIASNGTEALAIYRKYLSEISLVILDISMPIMDGRTVISELKKLNPNVKAIASTGLADSADIAELEEIGFSAVLMKPYSSEHLLESVVRVLEVS